MNLPVAHAPRRALGRSRLVVSCSLAAALAVGTLCSPARADNAAAAQALFDEGRALLGAGKLELACPKFEASLKLDKTIGTALNLGACSEKLGRVATAWAAYQVAFDLATKAGDPRATYAKEHRDALVPRLPKLTISITKAAERLSVWIGDNKVEPGAYGTAIPTDPGEATVQVRRGDEVLETKRVPLREAEGQAISLDLHEIEALAPPPKQSGPAKKSPFGPVGWAVGGLGVAGLVAGGVMLGMAASKKGQTERSGTCVGGACTPAGFAAIGEARGLAEASQWTFIAGGAVTAIGLTMVVVAAATGPSSSSPQKAGRAAPVRVLAVAPWAGPGAGGLTMGGLF